MGVCILQSHRNGSICLNRLSSTFPSFIIHHLDRMSWGSENSTPKNRPQKFDPKWDPLFRVLRGGGAQPAVPAAAGAARPAPGAGPRGLAPQGAAAGRVLLGRASACPASLETPSAMLAMSYPIWRQTLVLFVHTRGFDFLHFGTRPPRGLQLKQEPHAQISSLKASSK